jgi:hypothetical protein
MKLTSLQPEVVRIFLEATSRSNMVGTLPPDGSFSVSLDNAEIDFRVSTLPTIHGESTLSQGRAS